MIPWFKIYISNVILASLKISIKLLNWKIFTFRVLCLLPFCAVAVISTFSLVWLAISPEYIGRDTTLDPPFTSQSKVSLVLPCPRDREGVETRRRHLTQCAHILTTVAMTICAVPLQFALYPSLSLSTSDTLSVMAYKGHMMLALTNFVPRWEHTHSSQTNLLPPNTHILYCIYAAILHYILSLFNIYVINSRQYQKIYILHFKYMMEVTELLCIQKLFTALHFFPHFVMLLPYFKMDINYFLQNSTNSTP